MLNFNSISFAICFLSEILGIDRWDSAFQFVLLNSEPLANKVTTVHNLIKDEAPPLCTYNWIPG